MTSKIEREFRIEKVRELTSKSLTQREIATKLQISVGSVNAVIKRLRAQAKDNISKYVDQTLVYEFDRINTGLEQIIKNSWLRYDTATTDKERYMYLSLAKETYQVKAALLDSGTIIDKAIRFIQSHHNKASLSNADKARGLTQQNSKVTIDHTSEQAQSASSFNEAEQDKNNDKPTES